MARPGTTPAAPAAAPKKQLQVQIEGANMAPGAAAMASVIPTSAPAEAAAAESGAEATASDTAATNGDGNGTTARKTRRTKLDRVQDLLQKARDLLTAMDLGGGTLDGFFTSAIAEIEAVRASGFKTPRKRREVEQIWLKPDFLASSGLGDDWKQPLKVTSITDSGLTHVEGPDGSKMILARRQFATKNPHNDTSGASA